MPEPAKPVDPQPVDTEAIIRQSIKATQDADDAVDDEPVDEPPVTDPDPAVEPVVPPADPDPAAVVDPPVVPDATPAAGVVKPAAAKTAEDKFAAEHGLKATDKAGRENKIPYSAVKTRIVPNAIKAEKAIWEKDVLKPLQDKAQVYETRLHSIGETERLMFGAGSDGVALEGEAGLALKRTFLQQLANAVPGYAELLAGSNVLGSDSKTGVKQPLGTKTTEDDPEPKPDVVENGVAVGWTQAGLDSLRAWDRRQATREATEAAVTKLTQTYGLDKMHSRFESVEQGRSTLNGINAAIDEAATWPGFKDHMETILAVMNADTTGERDPRKLLERAYRTVLYETSTKAPRTEAELEASLRSRITAELAQAPRSTSASGGSVSTRAAEDADQTGDVIGDIIRRSIRGAK